ncbi:serine hydrolase domain-containing protein [Mumia sp. DW29H23]|uniref:serine hydrolase domain-containing protein n=1 Tax=Mumia sp. DW29H23 TaxID=3421241 RepID=UPI003D68DBD3
MTALAPGIERLLALGPDGRHPASAALGVVAGESREVAVGGWAVLPDGDGPGVPMSRDTLIDLASVTKVAVTTLLVMQLVADGRLDLADPVRRYLPAFAGDGKDDVTLEHLLTHTAGLRPWWPLYAETTDRDAAVRWVEAAPLVSAPGTAWAYSDLGLILAGRVVEEVTAMPLGEAFRTRVAEPLGLRAQLGPVAPERAAVSADDDAYEYAMVTTGTPYAVPFGPERFVGWRETPLRGAVRDGNAAHALGGVAGHAGLFATVDDLLTLGTAVRRGEIVPHDVLARFAEPSAANAEQAVGFRRRVLSVDGEDVTLLHHPGFTGTSFGFTLERDLVVAGAAMRLYGTVGPIAYDPPPTALPDLIPSDQIQAVVLEAGLRLLNPRPAVRNP